MTAPLLLAMLAAADGGSTVEALRLLEDSPAHARVAADTTVTLSLVVDENGDVQEVRLLESGGPEVDAAAMDAATRLRFSPERVDGQPVPAQLTYAYHFTAPPPPPPEAVLSGLVRARGTRRPIPGATLQVGDVRTETDPKGLFKVTVPPGQHPVRISAPGFKLKIQYETLETGQALEVVYLLEPERPNPYETVVEGERERTEVSRMTLHGQELREVPGTMGDPFRTVMLMPGVGSIVSGISYPVVRGTEPAATGYYLDGIRVPIIFHLGLGPAVVHPDFIESLDFYPGVPPAEYGGVVGGVVDGKVAHSRDDRVHATAYADLIESGLFAEVPIPETGTNVTIAGRLAYTAWLSALVYRTLEPPGSPKLTLDFWDYQGRIEQKFRGWDIRLLGFGSSDVFGGVTDNPDGTQSGELIGIVFHRVDLRARHALGLGQLELAVTGGVDKIGFESVGQQRFDVDEPSAVVRAKWSAPLFQNAKLDVGAQLERKSSNLYLTDESCRGPCAPAIHASVGDATITGAFGQLNWQPRPGLHVIPGLRLDDYHLVPGIDDVAFDPRLVVRKELSDRWTLKGGTGLFHMPPTTIATVPVVDVTGLHYGLQQSFQLDTGVEWKPISSVDVNLDGYFNDLTRTVELDPFQPGSVGGIGLVNGGLLSPVSHGYAYGLELLVRHPIGGNWFGWLSLTLQHSTRYMGFVRLNDQGAPIGVGYAQLPFTFDQTFVMNGVLSYRFPRNWTVGVSVHVNTGRPENGELSSFTEAPSADGSQWTRVEEDKVARLPAFFRLDVRAQKTFVFDNFMLEAYLDVFNATLSYEVLAFQYQTTSSGLSKTAESIPLIIPTLGVRATY